MLKSLSPPELHRPALGLVSAERRAGRFLHPGRAPVAAMIWASTFALASTDAGAAAVATAAPGLGALSTLGALLFIREWPVALTGSVWVAGTGLALLVWLLRSRGKAEWLSFDGAAPGGLRLPGRLDEAAATVADAVCGPDEVLAAARRCFLALQAAWDASDMRELRRHTTDQMLDELLQELPAQGGLPNRTDVVTLEAALLALEKIGSNYVASVEFSGMIRESPEDGAAPFKEVWMLTCHKDHLPAWRLARHQALW